MNNVLVLQLEQHERKVLFCLCKYIIVHIISALYLTESGLKSFLSLEKQFAFTLVQKIVHADVGNARSFGVRSNLLWGQEWLYTLCIPFPLPPPDKQLLPYPPPVSRCFGKDSLLMTPHHHPTPNICYCYPPSGTLATQ